MGGIQAGRPRAGQGSSLSLCGWEPPRPIRSSQRTLVLPRLDLGMAAPSSWSPPPFGPDADSLACCCWSESFPVTRSQ